MIFINKTELFSFKYEVERHSSDDSLLTSPIFSISFLPHRLILTSGEILLFVSKWNQFLMVAINR